MHCVQQKVEQVCRDGKLRCWRIVIKAAVRRQYGKNPGGKISDIFRVRNFREISNPVRQRCNDTGGGTC
jgi:hypothetical protein